jgi:predicted DNA binding protein
MQVFRVAIQTPEAAREEDFTARHPEVRFLFQGITLLGEGKGAMYVRVEGPGLKETLTALPHEPGVNRLEVVKEDTTSATLFLEGRAPPALRRLWDGGLIPQFPIILSAGVARVEFLGDRQRFQKYLTTLREEDHLEPTLLSVHDRVGEPALPLTPHQQEILRGAMRLGYYDYPRRITLTRLAQHLQRSKSTLSAALMRIENSIVQQAGDMMHLTDGIPESGRLQYLTAPPPRTSTSRTYAPPAAPPAPDEPYRTTGFPPPANNGNAASPPLSEEESEERDGY